MLKLKTESNTGSDTQTRDPTRPDPAEIADPVTRDPETRFHLCQGFNNGFYTLNTTTRPVAQLSSFH